MLLLMSLTNGMSSNYSWPIFFNVKMLAGPLIEVIILLLITVVYKSLALDTSSPAFFSFRHSVTGRTANS